jgi:hypothetical protein
MESWIDRAAIIPIEVPDKALLGFLGTQRVPLDRGVLAAR